MNKDLGTNDYLNKGPSTKDIFGAMFYSIYPPISDCVSFVDTPYIVSLNIKLAQLGFLRFFLLFQVPFLTDIKKQVTIVIPVPDILKIEMSSGTSFPLLFITTMPSTCDRVRRDLELQN